MCGKAKMQYELCENGERIGHPTNTEIKRDGRGRMRKCTCKTCRHGYDSFNPGRVHIQILKHQL